MTVGWDDVRTVVLVILPFTEYSAPQAATHSTSTTMASLPIAQDTIVRVAAAIDSLQDPIPAPDKSLKHARAASEACSSWMEGHDITSEGRREGILAIDM